MTLFGDRGRSDLDRRPKSRDELQQQLDAQAVEIEAVRLALVSLTQRVTTDSESLQKAVTTLVDRVQALQKRQDRGG